jgi:hypothetical protein
VEFRIGELPNDMKMVAYLSGELTNSSTYFVHLPMSLKTTAMITKNGLLFVI